ncbi:MAG: hypothetical protein ACOY3D_00720, partial [Candidatus Omnitrophota bacterium]
MRKRIRLKGALLDKNCNPRLRYAVFSKKIWKEYGIRLPQFKIFRELFLEVIGMPFLQDTLNLRRTAENWEEALLEIIKQIFELGKDIPAGLSFPDIETIVKQMPFSWLLVLHGLAYCDNILPEVREQAQQVFASPDKFADIVSFFAGHGEIRAQFLIYLTTVRDFNNCLSVIGDRLGNALQRALTSSPVHRGPGKKEARARDYFEDLFGINIMLFVLLTRRMALQGEAKAQSLRERDRLVKELLTLTEKNLPAGFLGKIRRAAELINRGNEPAAHWLLGKGLIPKINASILEFFRARLAQGFRRNVVRRQGRKLIVSHGVYAIPAGGKRPRLSEGKLTFTTSWEAFRGMDEQIDSELRDRRWAIASGK